MSERPGRDRDDGDSGSGPLAMPALSRRQIQLVDIILVLGAIALAIVVTGMLGKIFFDFGDVILTFFLAWLIAFILSPLVRWMIRIIPGLPRALAAAIVYVVLLAVTIGAIVFIAGTLATSIADFIAYVPRLVADLPSILQPLEDWLRRLGFSQVDVVNAAQQAINFLRDYASAIVGPLQSIAVASLSAMGTVLIVVILSVYIVIDQDGIRSFVNRLIPPNRREEFSLLETSVSRSFGGFLRGQAVIGLAYAVVALGTSVVLGLPLIGVTTAAAGVLMAIPFFGPFVSWTPPVIVAVFTNPGLILPTIAIMGVGWFVVMNILQPRLMAGAVGLHPIVVLAAVIIGSKVAGIAGAIFGIPIAAVLSSIFLHYLEIFGSDRDVASRAAKRLEDREGRPVRVPREPQPGLDADVE